MVKEEKWQEIKPGMYARKCEPKPAQAGAKLPPELLKELKENSGVWRYILSK